MKTNTLLVILALMGSTVAASAQSLPTPSAKPMMTVSQDHTMQDKMMDQAMKMAQMTSKFKGIEVNKGTATLYKGEKDGRWHIRWSDDFMIPGTPAPHWQIVDGDGNVFLLNRLMIKDDMQNRDIMLPKSIKSIAKVQIWCSFVEVVLGEASFGRTVKLG